MLRWESSIETGISVIDQDHKRLIEFSNFIKDAPSSQWKRLVSRRFLEDTYHLVRLHFDHEEEVMLQIEYRHLDDHLRIHSLMLHAFRSRIDRCSDQYDMEEAVNYIATALLQHKLKNDMPVINFIQSRRMKGANKKRG